MVDREGCWPVFIDYSIDDIGDALQSFIDELTEMVDSFSDNVSMYKEHQKKGTTNPSNRNKHEEGQSRKNKDQGGEKGDSRRKPNPNKRRGNSNNSQQMTRIEAGALVITSTAFLVVLVLDDGTGIGAVDDVAIVPTLEAILQGIIIAFS